MRALAILLLFAYFPCSAQETLMSANYRFPDGIYTCFRELLTGTPRYPGCSLDLNRPPAGNPKVWYVDATGQRQVFHDSCFCVVSEGKFMVRKDYVFPACIRLGAVSVFREASRISGQFQEYATLDDHYWLLDFETGDFFPFKRDRVDLILARDEELYKEFRDTRRNGTFEVMMSFLIRYNTRHPFFLKTQ